MAEAFSWGHGEASGGPRIAAVRSVSGQRLSGLKPARRLARGYPGGLPDARAPRRRSAIRLTATEDRERARIAVRRREREAERESYLPFTQVQRSRRSKSWRPGRIEERGRKHAAADPAVPAAHAAAARRSARRGLETAVSQRRDCRRVHQSAVHHEDRDGVFSERGLLLYAVPHRRRACEAGPERSPCCMGNCVRWTLLAAYDESPRTEVRGP